MGSSGAVMSFTVDIPYIRPPTPPREAPLRLPPARPAVDPTLSLSTPPNGHSQTLSSQGSSRRKRVEFSDHAHYNEAPAYDGQNVQQNPTPVSVPPPSSTRPAKSILKVSHDPRSLGQINGNGIEGDGASAVIAEMLDSTIQQLSGTDRASKLDAYMTLNQALKASDNLPDRIALQQKMTLFMNFIKEDIKAKTADGALDSQLANHAAILLGTLLGFPAIASALTHDFALNITEHCIRAFEDETTPKDVARHLMAIIGTQRFPSKVLNIERGCRLVKALHEIECHTRGRSILIGRILIYTHLLRHYRPIMIASHEHWIVSLFGDMTSQIKEQRSAAIRLGLEAAFTLGRDKNFSRHVMELLRTQCGEEEFIAYFTRRLATMTKSSEVIFVPQIWSAVLLFVPNIHQWDYLNTWLKIIQDCFNSPDVAVKRETYMAWDRLIYHAHFDTESFVKRGSIWAQPIISQLRGGATRAGAEERHKMAISSVCNLFYYAFKPTADLRYLHQLWDMQVNPIINSFIERRDDSRVPLACSILTVLLNGLPPRRGWDEDRVAKAEKDGAIKPDELPAMDAKWIRRYSDRVLSLVHPILTKCFGELVDPQSQVYTLWQTMMTAVKTASAKEIKVSQEMSTFVAHALGVVQQLWLKGLPAPKSTRSQNVSEQESSANSSSRFLGSMRALLRIMVENLGFHPFIESQLCRDDKNGFIMVTGSRAPKGRGQPRSAIQHLFAILSSLPPGVPDNEDFAEFLNTVFDPFFTHHLKTGKARLRFAFELLQPIPPEVLLPYGAWEVIAANVSSGFRDSQSSHHSSASSLDAVSLGHEYRDVVKILERGLRSVPQLPWDAWQEALATIANRVRDEVGDAGLALSVIEPLARTALDLEPKTSLQQSNRHNAIIELVSLAKHPMDRKAVESARLRLWNTTAGARPGSYDPYDNLYRLINWTNEALYDNIESVGNDEVATRLLVTVTGFLGDRDDHFTNTLTELQTGMACWIRDEKAKLQSRQLQAVTEGVKQLWDHISRRLGPLAREGEMPLQNIEQLLCAAFESKHRHIVNAATIMWNNAFGDAQSLTYPEHLKSVLLISRSFVEDLILPGLETASVESEAHQQRMFIDTQVGMDSLELSTLQTDSDDTPRPTPARRSHSPFPLTISPPSNQAEDVVAHVDDAVSSRQAAPRLRHDDSQVLFEPIESSPSAEDFIPDSQVLTERQREVRERQRESDALYSELRSSPEPTAASAELALPQPEDVEMKSPEPIRASTPEGDGTFDDLIPSTPTPRRGQALPILDQDIGDPPSSPPEPRRYPLLVEMSASSARSRDRVEWNVESSPLSASPSLAHHVLPVDYIAPGDDDSAEFEELPMAQAIDVGHKPGNTEILEVVVEGPKESTVSVAAALDAGATADEAVDVAPPVQQSTMPPPTTPPRRRIRMPRTIQETPKSDNEVFVDALSSPAPPTPKHLRLPQSTEGTCGKDSSFNASDMEKSMLRIAGEVDKENQPLAPQDDADISDCIVVIPGPSESTNSLRECDDVFGSSRSEAPVADTAKSSTSQPTPRRGRPPKRKRSVSLVTDTPKVTRLRKRQRPDSIAEVLAVSKAPASLSPEVNLDESSESLAVSGSHEDDRFASSAEVEESQLVEAPLKLEESQEETEEKEVESQIAIETEQQRRKSTTPGILSGQEHLSISGSQAEAVEKTDQDTPMGDSQAEQPVQRVEPQEKTGKDILELARGLREALRVASLGRDDVFEMYDVVEEVQSLLRAAERQSRL